MRVATSISCFCNPTDSKLPQTGIGALKDALSDSNLPILVDVLDWARIPEAFQREIARAHILLAGSTGESSE